MSSTLSPRALRLILDFNKDDYSPHLVARESKSMLLLPEFASEVYGFLDRIYAGTSLMASRALNELLLKLRHMLPVHHLTCEFQEDIADRGPFLSAFTGAFRMTVYLIRRDVAYRDVRRFKIHSMAGPAADCARVRRYLSNAHVADFWAPTEEPSFSLKMLAALVNRNFTVSRLQMSAVDGPLTDFRSMDAIFGGGVRLDALTLGMREECFERLIKTTDFMRMPTVQGLKEFKLELGSPPFEPLWPDKSWTLRQRAVVSSPLWIAGLHLLRHCKRFTVRYGPPARHLRSIARKLVEICEKFERGEVSEIVEHFAFLTYRLVAFPFSDDNKTATGVKVETEVRSSLSDYTWDVYRFRNSSTGEWLTASVSHSHSVHAHWRYSMLHIVKGESYPDASYAI
ncbi:hypothetical protein AAVH_23652 [Aphelenchoides avenae]|nr:hypothetical protein AAVH_23652 [Aphelenchus avenae]